MKLNHPRLALTLSALPLLTLGLVSRSAAQGPPPRRPNAATQNPSRVAVVFTGGYATDPQDRGRPVVLIASALGVPSEVFRAAFRNVRPAPGGQEPDPEQVRRNKDALLNALGRYGVTNERLDTVSNYYRYNGRRGEMWRHRDAAAYATVRDGKITGFTITDPGAGYSSAPLVTVPGMERLGVTATLAYGPEFDKNGSIKALTVGNAGSGRAQ